ncbi:hypothetical protein A3D80_01300 [Candidatus Roizmanbacteria bacterium RIFCSPHIGHO2_02_FULL_40_13b]|nr:MAG: hypothetical protein A3D80_01300 [Candidatus Roizmanbacteria bacterium RIFCSPHIGHO2_02_FULL_40_13b]OGK49134.1 MAG: hypothetical protein A3A56_00825 [Candidatus Roizmanbacteria bacterium RIFCSPLOWO2_01_FULL_40_32]OGK57347.1 MAG: hypothetical protein A3H83_01035 [Candidatus Roizmanbacteria bacterium RIFCSPLOWO2_02_FULL_39_8]
MNIQIATQLATPVLKEYGIKRASLFGSLVKGNMSSDSDIDILVETPPKFGLFKFSRMRLALQKALQRDVDLVTYKSISPYMKESILGSTYILYEA